MAHVDTRSHTHTSPLSNKPYSSLRIISLNIRTLANKTQHITQLLHKYKPDFITLQETNIKTQHAANTITHALGLKTAIHNIADTHGNGTSTLQTSDRWKITHTHTALQGRLTAIQITNRHNDKHTIINTYANANKNQQTQFYEQMQQYITHNFNNHNITITGDFNNITHTLDIKDTTPHNIEYRTNANQTNIQTLNNIIDTHQLQDIYRAKHPNGTDTTYTHAQTQCKTRLDRTYTNTPIQHAHIRHLPETLQYTDHKAQQITIQTPPKQNNGQPPQNENTWKFNKTLLENKQYVQTIHALIQEHTRQTQPGQARTTWDLLKKNIQYTSKIISKQISQERKQQKQILYTALQAARRNNVETHIIDNIQQQIDDMTQYKAQGAYIRTKWAHVTDETPNKQFLTTEQNIHKANNIDTITDTNGQTHTQPKQIANAFAHFYKKLYTDEGTDTQAQDNILKYAKQLTDEQKQETDIDITQQDILNTIKILNTDKSPGPDGLTSEFYQCFGTTLTPLLLQTYQESTTDNTLPHSFYQATIKVIPKDKNNTTDITKYRPISLLNTDYKILTKILTKKIEHTLEHIIHTDQQCSIPNRNITTHTHFIRDYIQHSTDLQTPTAILGLDQQKAFDRVSHTYLHKTLQQNNFHPTFTNWIQTIYKKPQSTVIVNKTKSDTFTLTRSVRQGCPISPILYIITLEPLLEKIRQNNNIHGTKTPGTKTNRKLLAYADDTTFLVQRQTDIKHIIQDFNTYNRASGAKININKSQIMGIGQWKNKQNIHPNIQHVDNIKIYGIQYSNTPQMHQQLTWKDILNKTKTTLDKYIHKTVTIFGRATIVNTLIIPKIIYATNITQPPKKFIQKLNTIIRNYIFQSNIKRIRHNTLIQPKTLGGIQLQDVETKIHAQRINYIKQIIQTPDKYPYAQYYIGINIRQWTTFHNSNPHHTETTPHFYKTCKEQIKNITPDILTSKKTTKTAYDTLIQQKHSQYTDIQWSHTYSTLDHKETFKNIHNKNTHPKDKEIAYRLIYNITPTTEGTAKRTNTLIRCKTCNRQIQETEKHIYLTCTHILPTKLMLKDTIQAITQQNNTQLDINRAIILHKLPPNYQKDKEQALQLIQTYKRIIWTVRNKTTHERKQYTPTDIISKFYHSALTMRQDLPQLLTRTDGQ